MNTKGQRNLNLDLVRILACVAVVGLHTVRLNGSFFYVALYNICGFAVPAFFMASGYMLLNRDALRPRESIFKTKAGGCGKIEE